MPMQAMDYSSDRPTRRARNKPIQSCEVVGILPAEELALRRALYASLGPEAKNKDASSAHKRIKIEEQVDEFSELGIAAAATATATSCIRLSSPELCDNYDSQSRCLERGGASSHPVSSCPSTPRSSVESLHLRLSPCSSWASTSDHSTINDDSCDSLFSPWSPTMTKKMHMPKKAKKGLDLASKRMLDFDWGSSATDVGRGVATHRGRAKAGARGRGRGKRARNATPSPAKPPGVKVQTARKSAYNSESVSRESTPFQAHRKFPANHIPPIRVSLDDVKPVTGLKEPPKTEDFITYLCLRGSSNIPGHLKQFETPWTRRKKFKSTKPRKIGKDNVN